MTGTSHFTSIWVVCIFQSSSNHHAVHGDQYTLTTPPTKCLCLYRITSLFRNQFHPGEPAYSLCATVLIRSLPLYRTGSTFQSCSIIDRHGTPPTRCQAALIHSRTEHYVYTKPPTKSIPIDIIVGEVCVWCMVTVINPANVRSI